MPDPKVTNGWNEWAKHVLAELVRLNDCYEGLRRDMGDLKAEVAGLQVKSGVWGLVGGLIPAVLAIAYIIMSKK